MASGPRFLSRRALLKLAATTPASALVLSSLAEQAIAENAAKSTTNLDDNKKLIRVARHLYQQFLVGVHKWEGDKHSKVKVEPEVFDKGFDLSGDVVAANLACFPDDPDNAPSEDIPTRRCAVACGWWAAELAHIKNGNDLDAAIFQRAWCDTKATFGVKKCDAANPPPTPVDCGPSSDVEDQLPEDLKPHRGLGILAAGCG